MPIRRLTLTNLAANAVRDFMLDADQGASNDRFLGEPTEVVYVINGTAVGVEYEIFFTNRRATQRSVVPTGGTLGLFPPLNEQAETVYGAAGEILSILVRETAGVATTDLNLAISFEPA